MMNVNIPDAQTISIGRGGKYGQLIVENTKFGERVTDHIWDYGLRQILNDAIAVKEDDDGEKLTNEELVAKATKRLQTLYSGELRARGTSEPVDPVEAEAYRIAWAAIVVTTKTFPEFPDTKGEKDRVMATLAKRAEQKGKVAPTRDGLIAQWLEANPKIRAAAKRIVAEREKFVTDIGIEL